MKYTPDALSKMAGTGILYVAHALSAISQIKPGLHPVVLRQLGMDHPDSDSLTRPVRTAFAHGLSAAELTGIGWPKLRLITAVMTPGNARSLTVLAKTLPVEVLAGVLGVPLQDPVSHVLTLRLDAVRWKVLCERLYAHGASRIRTGIEGAEEALFKALDLPDYDTGEAGHD